jgi:hypothetical protein
MEPEITRELSGWHRRHEEQGDDDETSGAGSAALRIIRSGCHPAGIYDGSPRANHPDRTK